MSHDIAQNAHEFAGSKCRRARALKNFRDSLKPQAAIFNGERIEYESTGSPQHLHKRAPIGYGACAQDQTERTLTEKIRNFLGR